MKITREHSFYDGHQYRWNGDYQNVVIEERAEINLWGDEFEEIDAFRSNHTDCTLSVSDSYDGSHELEISGWREATPGEIEELPYRIKAKAERQRTDKENQIKRLQRELRDTNNHGGKE